MFSRIVACTRIASLAVGLVAAQLVLAGNAFAERFVLAISVDGLRPDAVTSQGSTALPNFYKLRAQGSFTDNARADNTNTSTLPNHTTMCTSSPVSVHKVTVNDDTGKTIHSYAGKYISSMFAVAHDAGLRTAMHAGKSKFNVINRSYDGINGAAHANGKDKIDTYVMSSSGLVSNYITAMNSSNPIHLEFLHFPGPDLKGHATGWMSADYLKAVRDVDGALGQLFNLVNTNTRLKGKTWIILTADHGGLGKDHRTPSNVTHAKIPFYVWGPDVPAGKNLYSMNNGRRTDPGSSIGSNPIRNGDLGNLATRILQIGTIPGSSIGSTSHLVYNDGTAPEPTPDTQKPTAPSNVSAKAQSSSSILVGWTFSTDNIGVTGYDVYRGTGKVGSVASSANSFVSTGLLPATAYSFNVQARDLAGNLSALSASASTSTLSGTVTPPPPATGNVYEAEAALVFGAVKYTTYVDYINPSGDYVEWTISVPTAGTYNLGFKYAFGSGNRPLEIKVDGSVAVASLSFPGTGSTSTYKTVSAPVSLSAGSHKIRATAIGYSGGNMDSLTVSGP